MERLYNDKYLNYIVDEDNNIKEVYLSHNEQANKSDIITTGKVYSPIIIKGNEGERYGLRRRGYEAVIPVGIKEFPHANRGIEDIRVFAEIEGEYLLKNHGYDNRFQEITLKNNDNISFSNLVLNYIAAFDIGQSYIPEVTFRVGLEARVKTKEGYKWLKVKGSVDEYTVYSPRTSVGMDGEVIWLKELSYAKSFDSQSKNRVKLEQGQQATERKVNFYSNENIDIDEVIAGGSYEVELLIIPRGQVIEEAREHIDFIPWLRRHDNIYQFGTNSQHKVTNKNGIMQSSTMYVEENIQSNFLDTSNVFVELALMYSSEPGMPPTEKYIASNLKLNGYSFPKETKTAFKIDTEVKYDNVHITNNGMLLSDEFKRGVEEVIYVIEGKPINSQEVNELAVYNLQGNIKNIRVNDEKLKVFYEKLSLYFFVKMKSGIVITNENSLDISIGPVYTPPKYTYNIEEENFYNIITISRGYEGKEELKEEDGKIVIQLETSLDENKLKKNDMNEEVVGVINGMLSPNKSERLNDFLIPHGHYYRYRITAIGDNGKREVIISDIKYNEAEESILFNAITKEMLNEHNITDINKNRNQDKEFLKFIGRKRPVVDQSTIIEESYTFTSSFYDYKERLQLLNILREGNLLGYKDEFGNVIIGVLTNLNESESYDPLRFDITYTIEGVDYHAK